MTTIHDEKGAKQAIPATLCRLRTWNARARPDWPADGQVGRGRACAIEPKRWRSASRTGMAREGRAGAPVQVRSPAEEGDPRNTPEGMPGTTAAIADPEGPTGCSSDAAHPGCHAAQGGARSAWTYGGYPQCAQDVRV